MKKLDEIIGIIREHLPVLREKYRVKGLDVFGSYKRDEQKEGSDVDILVEFSKTIDLFMFMELEEELGSLLGIKVDLVMKDTLKPRIKERILSEAVPV
jgi:predicted nucleotidyltransferase